MILIYDQTKNQKLRLRPEVDVGDILELSRIPSDIMGLKMVTDSLPQRWRSHTETQKISLFA